MFKRIICSDEKGFTLIEVLLSISIFSILTIGMLQFFNQAMDFSNKNEDKTLGIYVARNMISYMEQQNFSNIHTFYLKDSGSTSIQSSACNNDKLTSEEMVLNQTEKVTIDGAVTSKCSLNFSPKINNRQFSVTVEVKKHTDKNLQSSLIPMTVNVTWDQSKTQLEGYIANENSR